MQRLVLRLAFCDHLTYCRDIGSLNTKKSLLFKALEQICSGKKDMVLPEGIELSTSPLPRECSTTELRQRRRDASRELATQSRVPAGFV